ncbi:hypothetical protein JX266_014052 [Neoarthrinium moseri]|nr:hypothetical protein JX266_014052 [Neoarthrinium moseri]
MDISGYQRFARVEHRKQRHLGSVLWPAETIESRLRMPDYALQAHHDVRRIPAHHEGITAHGEGIVGTSPLSGRVMKDNRQDRVYDP